MNVLYSAEQKCQPLGSQARTGQAHQRTETLKKKDLSFWCDSKLSASKNTEKNLIIKIYHFKSCVSLAKTGARTFDQNFVCLEAVDLQRPWRTDKQTNKHTQKTRLRKCVQILWQKIFKKNIYICVKKKKMRNHCLATRLFKQEKLWQQKFAIHLLRNFSDNKF